MIIGHGHEQKAKLASIIRTGGLVSLVRSPRRQRKVLNIALYLGTSNIVINLTGAKVAEN